MRSLHVGARVGLAAALLVAGLLHPAPASAEPGSGPRVAGGGNFSAAPELSDGRQRDSVRENEMLFYAVDVPPGGAFAAAVTLLGDPDGPLSQETSLEIAAYDVARQPLPELATAAAFTGGVDQRLELSTTGEGPAPMRYLSVALESEGRPLLEDRSYQLQFEIDVIGAGAPVAPAPQPTFGPEEPNPPPTGSPAQPPAVPVAADTPSGALRTLTAASGAFLLTFLIGAAYAWWELGRPAVTGEALGWGPRTDAGGTDDRLDPWEEDVDVDDDLPLPRRPRGR